MSFMSNVKAAVGSPWSATGATADAVSGFIPGPSEANGPNGHITSGIDAGYNKMSDAMMKVSPVVGASMKLAGLTGKAINAIGGGTDGMTKTDAIFGSSIGTLLTLGLNGFTGKKADTMEKDYATQAAIGSSYGGTYESIDSAMDKLGKKYGGFSTAARKRANLDIHRAGRQQTMMGDIANAKSMADLIGANLMSQASNAYIQSLGGGYDLRYMQAAKSGTKIQRYIRITSKPIFKLGGELLTSTLESFVFDTTYEEVILEPFAFDTSEEVQAFKEGGQMNVIPEGALHARKHGMENDEHITKKGIPVITEEEGGEIVLQAEIEVNEIIFTKEVTDKLEDLYKKFSDENASTKEKEEAAIEAGKLLATEIMDNTDDRTGLILSVE